VDSEILARNLHGVDLNPEPVEITKLSLWLKTAKRGKLLQDLDASIKCGNSLIANKNEHGRAFDWQAEFPDIFARGGFDIVLGNPPYVRQETIKPFKPYLAAHFAVYAGAADLYAYFYEKGFELLRPGGRLGYISSSTFFFAPARVNHCGTICARARKSRMLWISAICKSLKASRLIQRS
jgi:tRNA1(Val) A37 N6-methylase TrmN6